MELNVSAGVYAFEVIFLSKKLAANILTRWDRMEIIKKINNNSALARDAKGHEVVVFGKGIGFPPTPYELEDLSKIQRTFYYVDDKYYALLQEVPEEIFLAADDIAEDANEELNCDLNPNLAFILADHLNFAIERTRAGMTLRTPLAYDIRHLYPNEYKLGRSALHMLRDRLKVELPEQKPSALPCTSSTPKPKTAICTPPCRARRSSPSSPRSWNRHSASPWTGTASTIPASPCTCGIWCSG